MDRSDQPDPARPSEWQVIKADGSQARLADRVTTKLRQGGLLATAYGARNLRMDLDGPLRAVWERGHVPVGDLWSYYRKYPYLTRLRDRSVLDAAVLSVLDELTWEVEGFALAEGFEEAPARYVGLTIPHEGAFGQITDSTLLVLPTVARRQQRAERPPEPQPVGPPPPSGATTSPSGSVPPGGGGRATAPAPAVPEPPAPQNVRFFGVMDVNPERYSRDLTRVSQEILQHLAAGEGTQLRVRVEVSAVRSEGFPDDTVRNVTENARTLKFEQFGFERD